MTTGSKTFIDTYLSAITSGNTAALNQPIFVTENYHSHYDDDDAISYFYNPVTREFTTAEWTTRFACGGYVNHKDDVNVVDLIEAGLINKDQFIDDLIAKYGCGACGNGLYISGYPSGYAYAHHCGFPIILKGRKYTGNATLIAVHKGYISRYGRVESNLYEFITEDGHYYNKVSTKFDWDVETYTKVMTEKLHNMHVYKAIAYVLPWNEANLWDAWPIISTPNLEKLREAWAYEQRLKKLHQDRPFLEKKAQDLWNWAVTKFPNDNEDYKMANVKRCLCKYYGLDDDAYLESICKTIKK